jgi:hypothetical protein
LVADVAWVGQEVGEYCLNGTHLAQAPLADDLAHPLPLRMEANHERLGYDQTTFLLSGFDLTGFVGIEGDRLLAENMLACLQGLDGQ